MGPDFKANHYTMRKQTFISLRFFIGMHFDNQGKWFSGAKLFRDRMKIAMNLNCIVCAIIVFQMKLVLNIL